LPPDKVIIRLEDVYQVVGWLRDHLHEKADYAESIGEAIGDEPPVQLTVGQVYSILDVFQFIACNAYTLQQALEQPPSDNYDFATYIRADRQPPEQDGGDVKAIQKKLMEAARKAPDWKAANFCIGEAIHMLSELQTAPPAVMCNACEGSGEDQNPLNDPGLCPACKGNGYAPPAAVDVEALNFYADPENYKDRIIEGAYEYEHKGKTVSGCVVDNPVHRDGGNIARGLLASRQVVEDINDIECVEVDKKQTGIYRKYKIIRTDGKSEPGQKHYGCAYFVLDLSHDPHALPAIEAYANSCRADYPLLAEDLDVELAERRGDE
jgi:hypothetical protein